MSPRDTEDVRYHELGHASHYTEVGNGYWAILGGAMATAGFPSPYGNGNSAGGGRIAITEAWGFFIGHKLISDRYGCISEDSYGNNVNYCTKNEDGTRSDFSFIPFGVFHDLKDTYNSNETFDHVSGYSIGQVFNILSGPSNYTPVRFKNSFKSTYVPQNQQYKVDNLFEEYGY